MKAKLSKMVNQVVATSTLLFDGDDGLKCVVDANGNRRWFKGPMLHREDGPAVVYENGEAEYCQKDRLHREDGPAIDNEIFSVWALDGDVKKFVYKPWKQTVCLENLQLHNENGPAISMPEYDIYAINGNLHKEDGPAFVDKRRGYFSYWFNNGICYKRTNSNGEDDLVCGCGEIHTNNKPNPSDEHYYFYGIYHRWDGPAVCDEHYIYGAKYKYEHFTQLRRYLGL